MSPRHISKKIVLIGDGAVGKTSLIRKFVYDKFDDKYITTIGTKVTKKKIALTSNGEEYDLTLMIWDILGQKGYHSIQSKSYAGAAGGILVCDITRRDTLQSIEDYWIPNFREVAGEVPMILLANKVDLLYSLEFSSDEMQMLVLGSEEVEEVARRYNMPAWRTSAKTGQNVEKAFTTLARLLIGDQSTVSAMGGLAEGTDEPAPTTKTAAKKGPKVLRPEKFGVVSKTAVKKPKRTKRSKRSKRSQGMKKPSSPLVKATDKIIQDYIRFHPDAKDARVYVKKVFKSTNVDRRKPTIKGMLSVIDQLAEDEVKRLGVRDSRKNKRNRMLMIKESIG